MNESNGTVLDILIYVFDHYMLTEAVIVPERDELTLDLERAGFALEQVEQALDWLADLAGERSRPTLEGDGRAMRVFTESETLRLPVQCRGYLLSLERAGILSPQHREIAIERLLALQVEELDVDQLKWVVLMVLSSQPGDELACWRMEGLVFDQHEQPH